MQIIFSYQEANINYRNSRLVQQRTGATPRLAKSKHNTPLYPTILHRLTSLASRWYFPNFTNLTT